MNTSQNKVVAIHQPNFFPWLGYFNKIASSDVFVVMDNVQFPKTGRGTWMNRVRFMINGKATWTTVPVVRAYHGLRSVKEMEIDSANPWRTKLLRTIEINYSRAPFYTSIFPVLHDLVNHPTNNLSEYNLRAISQLVNLMGLGNSTIILGSSLKTEGNATDLLISMVKAAGGTTYLAGGGASGYQEDAKFAEAGLKLINQNFQHPRYPQVSSQEFIPGLSIIDILMNCGFENTSLAISASLSLPSKPLLMSTPVVK